MKYTVVAHPNSRRPSVETDLLGTLHVYVREPPLEGRANLALIESLADHFNVKKNHIRLLSGDKSKHKVIEIE